MKLSDVDVVVFDLDGTIYYGNKIIDGANEVIEFFRRVGKKIFFITNNSSKTRSQIYEKLIKIGVNCDFEEVLTSGYLASIFSKNMCMEDVYVFGSKNLIDEFKGQGITVNQTETAKNLLIGYNPKMTYDDLVNAIQVAIHAKYIVACNQEKLFPGENKKLLPGCGAMTASIEWCTGRKCDYIIGKPNTLVLDLLSQQECIDANRFLVIGDSYESDITMANLFGAKSIFVTSVPEYSSCKVNSVKSILDLFK